MAERADFHRVQTYGAAPSEGLAFREMALPLGLPSLYPNNYPSRRSDSISRMHTGPNEVVFPTRQT